MNTAQVPHWLDLFCTELACGPAFRRGLTAALAESFVARIGVSLDGFMLVPPGGGTIDIAVDAAGVASVSTDLVGPDAEGWPVTVAWQAAGVAVPLPADTALESASAAGLLRAWWAILPEDELRRAYAASSGPPWTSSPRFPFNPSEYPFAIEWKPFPWPDVWLQLRLSGTTTDAALAEVVPRLTAVQERWNTSSEGSAASGLIHQVGSRAAALASDVVVVNIDFGSADPHALVAMLKAIAAMTDRVHVTRVVVGSAVLAQLPTNPTK